MARKLRVEYRGAIYHVLNREDRREEIFKDDRERERLSKKTVCDYVQLNPAQAKLLPPAQALRGYRWSGWPESVKSSELWQAAAVN